MDMESLRDLYIEELKDLYSAEKQLLKALPKMAKNATSPDLKKAFTDHLHQTEGQVERLDQIFESLDTSPRGKKCVGMEGIIDEANELLEEDVQEDVLDAALISKAQHVEHYEIAGYGTVRAYALTLGETEHAKLLQQTLQEEADADELLTSLAERSINPEAAMAGAEASQGRSASRASTRSDREVKRHVASERNGSTKRARTTERARTSERKRASTSRESRAR